MDPECQCEDTMSIMMLENIKNKLIHAFRVTGEPLATTAPGTHQLNSIGRNLQANEELRRAKIEGAISWLRSELLEMRSQDRQLAETLLGLNSEIEKLRTETSAVTLDQDGRE
ncbi:protein FAM167A [Conger conger]|nr:protein FAM167A [Conger conger]